MCMGVCYCPFCEKAVNWQISIAIDMLLITIDVLTTRKYSSFLSAIWSFQGSNLGSKTSHRK